MNSSFTLFHSLEGQKTEFLQYVERGQRALPPLLFETDHTVLTLFSDSLAHKVRFLMGYKTLFSPPKLNIVRYEEKVLIDKSKFSLKDKAWIIR